MQPIQVQPAGRRVLPSEPTAGGFWQVTMGGRVVGWAVGYEAAKAKAQRMEAARKALPANLL